MTGARGSSDDGDVRALLGAYALDAVDDIERRAVDRLVASDPEAARELAGLTATAAMLGVAVAVTPPAGVRAAVLAEIIRTPQIARPGTGAVGARAALSAGAGRSVTATRTRRRAETPRRTVWLAVAASAIGAAAIPGAVAWQQAQQSNRVQQQVRAFSDLLADPGAKVVRAAVAGGGTAVGVLAGDRALFAATGLDDPGTDRVYQLWVLRDGKASSVAVMSNDAGRVRAVADRFATGDGLAVTVEPAGGSRQPTTDPIVVIQQA